MNFNGNSDQEDRNRRQLKKQWEKKTGEEAYVSTAREKKSCWYKKPTFNYNLIPRSDSYSETNLVRLI